MTFDQWWLIEYPKLSDGQTSFRAALADAFEAGRKQGWDEAVGDAE